MKIFQFGNTDTFKIKIAFINLMLGNIDEWMNDFGFEYC